MESTQKITNVEVVQNFLSLQYEGNIDDAFSNYAHQDFYWTVSTQNNEELNKAIPWAGKEHSGKKGYEELITELFGEYEAKKFEVYNYYEVKDKVFAVGHFDFQHYKTGKMAQSDFIGMFTVTDGKINGGQFYENTYAVAASRV
ncbi:MAG: nuclear transport factor 2 family protein [Bacteroidota bacterium]